MPGPALFVGDGSGVAVFFGSRVGVFVGEGSGVLVRSGVSDGGTPTGVFVDVGANGVAVFVGTCVAVGDGISVGTGVSVGAGNVAVTVGAGNVAVTVGDAVAVGSEARVEVATGTAV